MGKKLRPMKLDSGRVVCPVCGKELSKQGWYAHTCYKRYTAINRRDLQVEKVVTKTAPTIKPNSLWIATPDVAVYATGEPDPTRLSRLIEYLSMLLRWRTEDATGRENVADDNEKVKDYD